MTDRPTISIVVPAYNEAKRIAPTLQKIDQFFRSQRLSFEIIVVDDGSKDETKAVVEGLAIPNLKVVGYGGNRGKGYAVHFGALQAAGDWVLFTDADNSTPIEEFTKLWQFHNQYAVIIGSRYLPTSHVVVKQTRQRIMLSRLGNALTRSVLLPGIFDTQCGFKLFSRSCAQEIFGKQTIWGWGFDMELLRIARDQHFPTKEVGITWYNDTDSKIQSTRAFRKTFFELWKIKANSLRGLYKTHQVISPTQGVFFRFLFVGAVGTLLDFFILNVTHAIFHLDLTIALTLGFLSGAINNYIWNSLWSFKQTLTWKQLCQFLVVAAVGLLFNNEIVLYLTKFGWNYNAGKLIALVVVFFWNFFVNRYWTFRSSATA